MISMLRKFGPVSVATHTQPILSRIPAMGGASPTARIPYSPVRSTLYHIPIAGGNPLSAIHAPIESFFGNGNESPIFSGEPEQLRNF